MNKRQLAMMNDITMRVDQQEFKRTSATGNRGIPLSLDLYSQNTDLKNMKISILFSFISAGKTGFRSFTVLDPVLNYETLDILIPISSIRSQYSVNSTNQTNHKPAEF